MKYIIYKIINLVNNKPYIGKTTQTLHDRWLDHIYEAKRWKKCKESSIDFGYNSRLYPAMNKYGHENFLIQPIDEAESIEELNKKEKYWIDFYDARKSGYNIAAGGHGGFFFGCHHSSESIEKIRKAGTGLKRTQETCAKISKGKKGHVTSEATKEKIRKAKTGRKFGKHPDEWNANISLGHMHEVLCVETGVIYRNAAEAARQTGIRRSAIANCLAGISKTSGKCHWKYL
jgi:group I intron endonuclease